MKQPPTEAALIRLAIKLGYHALALPKLDILAVDELLCGFNVRVDVRAIKLDRADKMAIVADDVNPIIGQLRHPAAGSRPDYAFTGIEWRLFGFRLETKTIPAVLSHQTGPGEAALRGQWPSGTMGQPPMRRHFLSLSTRSISVSASLIAKARLTRVIPDLLLPSPNLTSHRQPLPSVN